jgi:IS30 family transposase
MKNKELTSTDREEISRLLPLGISYTDIATIIGKSKSCISREVSREGMNRKTYRAWLANIYARREKKKQGRKKRLEYHLELRTVVFAWLKKRWSPEQIVERLKTEYPKRKDMRISTETIYSYLYVHPKQKLRRELIACLRRQRKVRKKRRKPGDPVEKRGKIPNMTSIDERPSEINDRIIPGHWEGDLMVGIRQLSAIGTLTERTTRITIITPLKNTNAKTVREAFAREMNKIPTEFRQSLTYDQGREMKQHKLFSQKTKVKVYFAHKSSPWERGTNENTNGLIRQYFPRGTDFNKISRYKIKKVQAELNDRPRKCLGFKKPIEVFNQLLQ